LEINSSIVTANGQSASLAGGLKSVSGLANEICGDCVREVALCASYKSARISKAKHRQHDDQDDHQGKLAAEKGSTLTRVQVDTNLGVVQLSGVVDSAVEWSLAERVARGVGGVKGVTNNLQVK
jgi:osmotically-inducible protein OsmY